MHVVVAYKATLSRSLQNRLHLQLVLYAVTGLVRKSEHIIPLLRELHWLQVLKCIQFWLCVLPYHCVHGTVPA